MNPSDFTQISTRILQDTRISADAKGVYCVICAGESVTVNDNERILLGKPVDKELNELERMEYIRLSSSTVKSIPDYNWGDWKILFLKYECVH